MKFDEDVLALAIDFHYAMMLAVLQKESLSSFIAMKSPTLGWKFIQCQNCVAHFAFNAGLCTVPRVHPGSMMCLIWTELMMLRANAEIFWRQSSPVTITKTRAKMNLRAIPLCFVSGTWMYHSVGWSDASLQRSVRLPDRMWISATIWSHWKDTGVLCSVKIRLLN